jgi:hypothetical protein
MARPRKKPKGEAMPPAEAPAGAPAERPVKRYPSRENTKYVGIPVKLWHRLKHYAEGHSTEWDEKSISWALRNLLAKALEEEE